MFKLKVLATGSEGNSALVSDGHTAIALDVGINPMGEIEEQIKAVLLTHEHL